jgi:hypothetical protein
MQKLAEVCIKRPIFAAMIVMALVVVGWCPSIACITYIKWLRSDVGRLLIEPVAKVRGHAIAQQLLHSPHVVRHSCCHSRCDWLPFLG